MRSSGIGRDAPPVSRVLVAATALEAVILIVVGAALFAAPSIAEDAWPWRLTPFNTRFMGSIYLSALVPVVVLLRARRWDPGRFVVPSIFVFTAVVAVVSVIHENDFLFGERPVVSWGWFLIYTFLAVNAGVHVFLSRGLPLGDRWRPTGAWRGMLVVQGLVLAGYGIALLVAPGAASDFWPWPIDDLHAQMYSAMFLTGGVGSLVLARAASPLELFTGGLTEVVFGATAILGLAMVDSSRATVGWDRAGTWVWIGGFALILLAGAAIVQKAQWFARAGSTGQSSTPRSPRAPLSARRP